MSNLCCKEFTIVVTESLPYAYFKLDDDPSTQKAIEEIAGFDLTSTKSYSQWPTAKIGTALWDPWLGLSNTPSSHWDFSATGFTIRLWFQMGTVPVANTFFIINGATWDLTLQWSGAPSLRQFPRFRVPLVGGDASVDGPDLTDTSSFHRLMSGWEKGVGVWIKFDNDATIKSANANNAAFAGAGEGLFLGPTNESQQMGIDEVAIWNKTLTEAEMTYDWNAGAGRTYP